MKHQTIVVADDEPGIRELVTELLEDEGYEVQAVGDGLSALVAIKGGPPALALLDVAMPVMTGDETLREIRAAGPNIPVVIMTAGTNPQRFLAEGATEVLAKPFEIRELLNLIARLLGREGGNVAVVGDSTRGPGQG